MTLCNQNVAQDPAILFDRAAQCLQQGRLEPAEADCHALLAGNPENPPALHLLGLVYMQAGHLDAAIDFIAAAVSLDGRDAAFHANLGVAKKRKGEALLAAARRGDGEPAALQHEGDALLREALKHQERAVKLKPDFANAQFNRAALLKKLVRWQEALRAFECAKKLLPEPFESLNEIGQIQLLLGDTKAARATFLEASGSPRSGHKAYSNYLLALNYDEQDAEDVFAAHRQWAGRYAADIDAFDHHANSRDPDRRLNIGYVSPDLHAHSVAYFASPLIDGHDRERFRVVCYSDSRQQDAVQRRLKDAADIWRDTSGLSDGELAALIRADGIDILVDLAGHTSRNRLRVFAAKPAPLQVSYIGYPNTTGLDAMDYRITDAVADPPENDALHSETLLRLPSGFLCYRPSEAAGCVAGEECVEGVAEGTVFGCFNVQAKLSDATLDMWAAVLGAVPDSTLVIKNVSMVDGTARKRLLSRFRQRGIKSARLRLIGWQAAIEDHFRLYRDIDVALDTWPYNGTTTTCEALYMGTPVVTRAGATHASRVGSSLLSRIGMHGLVADTAEGYVRLCKALAADPGRRHELGARASDATRSVLCDADRLVREFEAAMYGIWHRWCGAE